MPHLKLKLLGSYHLSMDGHPINTIESDKARALLAYLAVENDLSHPREKLVGLFWPEQDEEHARGSLSQALYHLRGILGDRPLTGVLNPETSYVSRQSFLLVTHQGIQFNPSSDYEMDVADISTLIAACKTHSHLKLQLCNECLEHLQEAARIYSGDFLDGFYLPKNIAFEEWVTVVREQFHLDMMEVLEHLVLTFESQGELDKALGYACKMLILDDIDEAGIGHIMRLLALLDKREEALAQYINFHQALAIQMGSEPGAESRLLYQRLRSEQAGEELGYLPTSLTAFIGRKQELNELWGWLCNPARRIICILGAGGSGKTRLALEAAKRQRYRFRDGVYFMPLSALGSGSSILAAIAEGLGFIFRDFGDHKQQLLDYLHNKKVLLILDSFETVVASAGLVAELLSASEGSKALVTSRVRLNLGGEQVFSLAGMRFPTSESKEQITDFSSVGLFLDAARRVIPDYEPHDLEGIARICRLVEGMPLSLLLASSWVNEYTPQEIAEQIERSLDFLSVEWSDLPKRQRSLRATFEYSWKMLSVDEQRVLMNLAVLRNPFSAQAAWHVADASPQVLHNLNGKSLLGRTVEGIFQMHDVVRQYSEKELVQTCDEQEKSVRQKHANYFMELVAGWSNLLKSPGQLSALIKADKLIEDVKAAWVWTAQLADLETLSRVSEGLFLYYFLRYRFQEGEHACQVALNGIQSAAVCGERLNLEGFLLAWQVHFNRLLGKREQARQLAQESFQSLAQAEASGQDARQGQALLWRERGYLTGNLPEQIECFRNSAELFQELGDSWWQAYVLTWAGEVTNRMGNSVLALELHQQAVALSRVAGEPRLLARALINHAYDHLTHESWEAGAKMMEEAAGCYQSVGDLGSQACGELHLGVTYGWTGRLPEACAMLENALAKLRQLGDRYYTAYGTGGLGVIHIHSGKYEQAALSFQEVIPIVRQDGYLREEAFYLAQTGSLAMVRGELAQAIEVLEQSVASFRKMGFAGELGMALGGLALAQHLLKQDEHAKDTLQESLGIAAETSGRFTLFTLPAALVVILADDSRWEQSLEAYSAVMTDPIVANSQWLVDMIGDRIERAREQLSADARQAAERRGREGNLFEVLGRLAKEINSWGW